MKEYLKVGILLFIGGVLLSKDQFGIALFITVVSIVYAIKLKIIVK